MAIIDSLNQLETNIANAKQTLVDNMNAKGVSVTTADTLTNIAKKVSDISQGSGGGGDFDFAQIGYTSTSAPAQLITDFNYSKEIYNTWNPSTTDAKQAFSNDKNLVYFPLVDTSNITNMNQMFYNCTRLAYVPTLNTSNVTNMSYMFQNCIGLYALDVSNWDTSNVTDMNTMFYGCYGLTSLDVSNWDTSNVTSMWGMFTNCSGLTSLDVSNWDTSNVTRMTEMFLNCSGLTSLDVSNWDTSNVTNMSQMFSNCSGLTSLDVSNWDTSNVTNMGNMFYQCSGLTSLDLTSFDTSNVTVFYSSIYGMFSKCKSLEKIDGYLDYSLVTKNGYSSSYTFEACSNLRKFEARNMGSLNQSSAFYFAGNSNGMKLWGENTDDIPDARESMINTLITYSFDRASAGYTTTCTIALNSNAKARLSEDEIAQITSKGYTIA